MPLDPDATAAEAGASKERGPEGPGGSGAPPGLGRPGGPPPPIDTRRYRWMIGIFGLTLVLAASVYQFAKNGVGSPGITPGKRLHFFVAPLAGAARNFDANTNPHCDPAHPNPQGLNVCGRSPLALAFFVTGSGSCLRQVDALQSLSRSGRFRGVQFAAVAVRATRSQTAALARARGWTIPVAYDRDGAVGSLYGIEICPMVELAYRGGIVADRLIGEKWISGAALAPHVQKLVAPGG